MFRELRKAIGFIERGKRGRWWLLVVLAMSVSIVEAGGAVLTFVLLGMLADPESLSIPVVGHLRTVFPSVGQAQMFTYLATFMAIFFLFRGFLILLQTYLQQRIAFNAGVSLSTRLLSGYLAMPYSFHLQRNSAQMIRNAHDSVDAIVRNVFMPLVAVVSEALMILGIITVLMLIAPSATLLAVGPIGILILLLLRALQPRLSSLGSKLLTASTASFKALQEALEGIRDLKVLGRNSFFQEDFARHRFDMARSSYLGSTLANVPRVVVETGFFLFLLIFLAFSGQREGNVGGDIAFLGLLAYSVMRVMPAAIRIAAGVNSLRFGTAAINDVHTDLALIEYERRDRSPHAPAETFRSWRRIALEGVAYRYEGTERDVLSDIDISIERGQSIGIVGPTGGGKTTLADILLGLLAPTSGALKVDGVDLKGNIAAWQENLGMVSQSVFLLDATLRRNIALGLEDRQIEDKKVAKAVQLAQLERFITSLPGGLDTIVGERGVRLSGGQRQRVAIARALYREPSVLVFDEGTSALDNVTEAELVAAIEQLGETRTTIIIAHRLSTVRNCDRIFLIKDGRISSAGSYDELIETDVEFRRLSSTA